MIVNTYFLIVRMIHNINHSLSIGVSLVAEVRWSIMDHRLIDWISGFIRKDTSGEARY